MYIEVLLLRQPQGLKCRRECQFLAIEMMDFVKHRYAVASFLLVIYGICERQWQLGVIISAPLSAILCWKCKNPLLVILLFADCFLFLNSFSLYCYIPFLISQTLLLTTSFPNTMKVMTAVSSSQSEFTFLSTTSSYHIPSCLFNLNNSEILSAFTFFSNLFPQISFCFHLFLNPRKFL